jgi:hypothetical protein
MSEIPFEEAKGLYKATKDEIKTFPLFGQS